MNFGSMEMGLGGARSNFSLSNYLAGLLQSVYYDNTNKYGNLFTTSAGPTPVSSYGDPVGLGMSVEQWGGKTLTNELAGQSELLNPASWVMTNGGGGSAATNSPTGTLNITGDGTNSGAGSQVVASTAGFSYGLTFTVSGNSVVVRVGTSNGGNQLFSATPFNPGTYTIFFPATTATSYVYFNRSAAGTTVVTAISCKLVPGYPATQSSSTLRPTWQSTGAKGDGIDDQLGSTYKWGSAKNFVGVRSSVPASLASTQIILGSNDASSNRGYLGIDTSGHACAGVGGDGVATIVGTSDLRGTTADIFLTFDGSTVRLIVNGAVEYEAAQNGSVNTTVAWMIFALNNNGSASSNYAGYIPWIVGGTDFISAPRAVQIAQQA